jgi:hypothetical protein
MTIYAKGVFKAIVAMSTVAAAVHGRNTPKINNWQEYGTENDVGHNGYNHGKQNQYDRYIDTKNTFSTADFTAGNTVASTSHYDGKKLRGVLSPKNSSASGNNHKTSQRKKNKKHKIQQQDKKKQGSKAANSLPGNQAPSNNIQQATSANNQQAPAKPGNQNHLSVDTYFAPSKLTQKLDDAAKIPYINYYVPIPSYAGHTKEPVPTQGAYTPAPTTKAPVTQSPSTNTPVPTTIAPAPSTKTRHQCLQRWLL